MGSLKTLKQWKLCEHDEGGLHQDVSVTIQPASFLYELTAELQLAEYRFFTSFPIEFFSWNRTFTLTVLSWKLTASLITLRNKNSK